MTILIIWLTLVSRFLKPFLLVIKKKYFNCLKRKICKNII